MDASSSWYIHRKHYFEKLVGRNTDLDPNSALGREKPGSWAVLKIKCCGMTQQRKATVSEAFPYSEYLGTLFVTFPVVLPEMGGQGRLCTLFFQSVELWTLRFPHSPPLKLALLLFPFYRWGNGHTERLGGLPKITQLNKCQSWI